MFSSVHAPVTSDAIIQILSPLLSVSPSIHAVLHLGRHTGSKDTIVRCTAFYFRWQEVQSARVGSSGDRRAEDSGLRPPTGRSDSCYEKCQGVRRQGEPAGEDRVSEHTAADAVDRSKQLWPWQLGRRLGAAMSAGALQLRGSRLLCVRVNYFLLWSMWLERVQQYGFSGFKLNG